MTAAASSLIILTELSKTLNPQETNNISHYVTTFDFDAYWNELKSDPAAADVVQFFDTDPPSLKIGGVSYYRGGEGVESQ